jgi:hypothetical protein
MMLGRNEVKKCVLEVLGEWSEVDERMMSGFRQRRQWSYIHVLMPVCLPFGGWNSSMPQYLWDSRMWCWIGISWWA